jgi:hypothetical protein
MNELATLSDLLARLSFANSMRPCDVAVYFPDETEEAVSGALDRLVDAGLVERYENGGVPHYLRKQTSSLEDGE